MISALTLVAGMMIEVCNGENVDDAVDYFAGIVRASMARRTEKGKVQ